MDHWWVVHGTHLGIGYADFVTSSACEPSPRMITQSRCMETTGFCGNRGFSGLIHFDKELAGLGSDLSFKFESFVWYLKEEKKIWTLNEALQCMADASHAFPAELFLPHWLHNWSSCVQNKLRGTTSVDCGRNFVLRSGSTLSLFWGLL